LTEFKVQLDVPLNNLTPNRKIELEEDLKNSGLRHGFNNTTAYVQISMAENETTTVKALNGLVFIPNMILKEDLYPPTIICGLKGEKLRIDTDHFNVSEIVFKTNDAAVAVYDQNDQSLLIRYLSVFKNMRDIIKLDSTIGHVGKIDGLVIRCERCERDVKEEPCECDKKFLKINMTLPDDNLNDAVKAAIMKSHTRNPEEILYKFSPRANQP
jgi:hypothetical protein